MDFNDPMTLNKWNYTGSNPINYADPTGKFLCVPGCCEEWVISALAQLTVYGGPFSHYVVSAFDILDRYFPMLIFFTTENFGASPAPYVILMPKGYIDSNLPPSRDQIAHFGHEVVHQTQATERYTTWGEAQAYIYSGKIAEELGGKPLGIEQKSNQLSHLPAMVHLL